MAAAVQLSQLTTQVSATSASTLRADRSESNVRNRRLEANSTKPHAVSAGLQKKQGTQKISNKPRVPLTSSESNSQPQLRGCHVITQAAIGGSASETSAVPSDEHEQAEQLVEEAQNAAQHWWKTSPNYVKYPVVTFAPFFLLVLLFAGPRVTLELTPLWLIGPTLLSAALYGSKVVVRVSQLAAVQVIEMLLHTVHKAAAFVEYARRGTIAEDLRLWAEVKLVDRLQRAQSTIALKRAEVTEWLSSGRAAEDIRHKTVDIARAIVARVQDWLLTGYENVLDWWRPKSRSLKKLLAKLF